MVCPRCITAVQGALKELQIDFESVKLGEVAIQRPLRSKQQVDLQARLKVLGFELIESRQKEIIEKIKLSVRGYLSEGNERKVKLSIYITQKLPFDYSYLSDLFSSVEGITIEKYFIQLRIEKVKEYVVYNKYSLAEIAEITGFSSSQHLSTQFKQITGLSPGHFKELRRQKSNL
jgi:AraC-like DNA-binding protein